jgi:polysaccharide export outer membrane protein
MIVNSLSKNTDSNMRNSLCSILTLVCLGTPVWVLASGPQQAPAANASAPPAATTARAPAAVPSDYLIGADDLLSIVFWRDRDLSGEVVVRPDGKISLPLINDIQAAGLTPEQLRASLEQAAGKFIEDPNAAVIVKEIRSRRVFITGQVTRPGPYPLTGSTTVLQLIAMAGGLLEYADAKNITVMRTENGRPVSLKFNYKDVVRRKRPQQNVELRPGDTVVVP